ncbi:hypothetical protein ACFVUW_07285 [Streptomyces xiamenensis]|uniref:hypothetical protein n=1 Tax=Streptomyces xiamenensis TaxID=408015 RepID=UPI0036F0E89E
MRGQPFRLAGALADWWSRDIRHRRVERLLRSARIDVPQYSPDLERAAYHRVADAVERRQQPPSA